MATLTELYRVLKVRLAQRFLRLWMPARVRVRRGLAQSAAARWLLGLPRTCIERPELEKRPGALFTAGAGAVVALSENYPRYPAGADESAAPGPAMWPWPFRLFRLPNARICGPSGAVITADGSIIGDSFWNRPPFEVDPVYTRLRFSRARRLPGSYCTLTYASGVCGYYHWMFESLPRLLCAMEAGAITPDTRAIVNGHLQDYQLQTLAFLGFPRERLFVIDEGVYEVETLLFPTTAMMNPLAVSWLRSRFAAWTSPDKPVRLYISRAKAQQRRVLNEEALLPILQKHGLTVINAEDLDVEAQVRLFARADVLVGPHGAGLTNMVFAPPPCKVVELCHPQYCCQYIFFKLAAVAQHHYTGVICKAANRASRLVHQSAGKDDLLVDPQELDRVLTAVL
jgi:Glycosyltransferase 61